MNDEQKHEEIHAILKTVDDPELPSVSVVDLGMVHEVTIDQSKVSITMVPTFAGCPALDFIEKNVKSAVGNIDWVEDCLVAFSFQKKWSTDAITDEGKEQLKKHGVSPPPENYRPGEEWSVNCPYCGSAFTSMENVFGPTACRSILYCGSCKNPFEAMKPVVNYSIVY
ncbi:phenylacetate-CoA oxygenase subunit PaaJ [Halobacillus shinanisalinarum]|uniref:Phenylacetate-CoA oxygenase subunit PaaJ n=1 Tax=Halobacillus shinanisalinarum TaxID=2932258 RepID=A0ABY4GWL8_9BACI|nr:1,2-phenylacetyl-CoA epoxidase subunit PaaD [Halobacillus shinanisalinarum]UOQ92449.1 phenylacetate-CoA oxygenase subunit PaaJ [Halobacillus shinanisalinarum]